MRVDVPPSWERRPDSVGKSCPGLFRYDERISVEVGQAPPLGSAWSSSTACSSFPPSPRVFSSSGYLMAGWVGPTNRSSGDRRVANRTRFPPRMGEQRYPKKEPAPGAGRLSLDLGNERRREGCSKKRGSISGDGRDRFDRLGLYLCSGVGRLPPVLGTVSYASV